MSFKDTLLPPAVLKTVSTCMSVSGPCMAHHGCVWCGVVWCGVVWCGTLDVPLETRTPCLHSSSSAQFTDAQYTTPTIIQAQGWPLAMSGSDLVAIASTGSGKTAGFIVPGLMHIAAKRKHKDPTGRRRVRACGYL